MEGLLVQTKKKKRRNTENPIWIVAEKRGLKGNSCLLTVNCRVEDD